MNTQTQDSGEVLDAMVRTMKDASPLYAPSVFWQQLQTRHIEELGRDGFANFKRTLNMKYFNWSVRGIVYFQLMPVLWRWLKSPTLAPFVAKFSDYRAQSGSAAKSFNFISALVYKIFVAMFADFVRTTDPLGLIDKLAEPPVGNPFVISYGGRRVSQDLCNSIHEFYSATSDTDRSRKGLRVAELGAGYGRLGQVFLSALEGSSYTVIDIPPALYVSQRYLSEVFPALKVFTFREFKSFEDVREEYEASRIRFLAANQIELLPKDSFDLFVNVSSLHEMTYDQIANYLKQIDRLCRGQFYSKQWKVSRGKAANGFTIKEFEYPTPKHWAQQFHRTHPIQRMFFEALYRT